LFSDNDATNTDAVRDENLIGKDTVPYVIGVASAAILFFFFVMLKKLTSSSLAIQSQISNYSFLKGYSDQNFVAHDGISTI
jgi:hypothetical protein